MLSNVSISELTQFLCQRENQAFRDSSTVDAECLGSLYFVSQTELG